MQENSPTYRWIDDPADLPSVIDAMQAAPWIALDTESNSAHVYREQVCLMQLNCNGEYFMIDTLALGEGPEVLSSMAPILADPDKPLFLHGGEYDVICLKRSYNLTLRGVFDSQQASSMLGWERTGYGAVVERCCEVQLDKAYSQYDWGTRPIDPEALRYALDDVVHLPEVCRQLQDLVAEAGLTDEVAIGNQAVMEAEPRVDGFDIINLWRIKGIFKMTKKALPMLTALYCWRDEVAKERNQPPGRLINNEALIALAREAPVSFNQLKRCRMKAWFLREYGDALLDCVKAAKANPPDVPERPRRREVDPTEEAREKRLKDWRKGEAAQRKVPLQVVLPAKALEHLKRFGPDKLESVPQLGQSRIARYGKTLAKVCAGS